MTQSIAKLESVTDLKMLLAKQYQAQIVNYFGDNQKAMKFLSAVTSAVQRTPKLLECEPVTLINSFMMMAQLEFMPSGVSGEAYVLPYNKNVKVGNVWQKTTEAQFQLGYQGLVTLFYRSGIRSINAEIVYQKDKFDYKNGLINHQPDVFNDDRGEAIGAYVIVELQTGGRISKAMSKKEILTIGQNFSKSYYETDYHTKKKTLGKHTPWNVDNDPQLNMWKKTVLIQIAKLVPKNETINQAISEDYKDSVISDKKEEIPEELNTDGFEKEKPVQKFVIAKENENFVVYDEKMTNALHSVNTKEEAEEWVNSQKIT